jgi:hypothetical protein
MQLGLLFEATQLRSRGLFDEIRRPTQLLLRAFFDTPFLETPLMLQIF